MYCLSDCIIRIIEGQKEYVRVNIMWREFSELCADQRVNVFMHAWIF